MAAGDNAPIAHIADITPFPAHAKVELTFNGTGNDLDGYLVYYEWDFQGDGTPDWNSSIHGVALFAFSEEGIYAPALRVQDNNGSWSEWVNSSLQVGPALLKKDEGDSEDLGPFLPLALGILGATLLIIGAMAVNAKRSGKKLLASIRPTKSQFKCPNCFSPIKSTNLKCLKCGISLEGLQTPEKPEKEAAKEQIQSKTGKFPLVKLLKWTSQESHEKPIETEQSYLVEEVFLVALDGRVMAHVGQVDSGTDYELVGGMFTAVMDFVKDSFGRPGHIGAIEYGDSRIFIEMGKHSFMVLVVYGEPPKTFKEMIGDIVPRIETYFTGCIEQWSGDRELLAPAREFLTPLILETAGVTKQQVKASLAKEEVKLVSAWEYYRGCVRLKIACVNFLETVITDVKLDIDFDHKLLRWDHHEPNFDKDGSRVNLGLVEGGGKKTVAVSFDPLMCQKTSLNAIGTYKDAKGELHTVKMKRRPVEVVCPLFFTPENASTAMLKKLIEEDLKHQDSKIFLLTEKLTPAAGFELSKETLDGRDVKFVKQFIQHEPYKAEAWYYGVTKVKQDQLVVRVSVDEEAGVVSFYAAAGDPKALVGLLAELGHDLVKQVAQRGIRLRAEADRLVKEEILAASYLLQDLEGRLSKEREGQGEHDSMMRTDIINPNGQAHRKKTESLGETDDAGKETDNQT